MILQNFFKMLFQQKYTNYDLKNAKKDKGK
jgi:hypothetical protein